ncbi:RGA2 [[Candida] subhashii]|uniref:RGA2 n=1 Tax=[Candida] subhashii TaxID=561895 RepID=A0A8J5QNZ0_9ASCO|nr:RGA2 [[Candida] subhashii]KAG7665188.1 RGA2 [[Candida] subhashii]
MTEVEMPHGTPNTNPFHASDSNNGSLIAPDNVSNHSREICKKCNQPINEGHAYELGEDRWHINCFNCSKCNISLGCNSNFLVLGNGNLICSNCSYNCKQCGRKIDDLAILTGDQAYCSNCFKCRSCKNKIEDLRYARTSKGLFCMECHEKLMARKKKYDAKKKKMALMGKQKQQQSQLEEEEEQNSQAHPQPQHQTLLQNLQQQEDVRGSVDSHRESLIQAYLHTNLSGTSDFETLKTPSPALSKNKNLPLPPPITDGTPRTPPLDPNSRDKSKDSTPISFISTDIATTTNVSSNVGSLTHKQLKQTEAVDNDFSIEEVQNSDEDEEQGIRKETSLRHKSHSPSKLQNHVIATPSSSSHDTESILDRSIYNEILVSTPPPPTSAPEGTKAVLQLEPPANIAVTPKQQLAPPTSKNVLILSPNQYNDNQFHNMEPIGSQSPIKSSGAGSTTTTSTINSNSNSTTSSSSATLALPIPEPSRSLISSPIAKANRQARVVETTSDEILSQEITDDDHLNDLSRTPSKPKSPFQLSSPPPRMPVPSTPPVSIPFHIHSTPDTRESEHKTAKPSDPQAELKGLGLLTGESDVIQQSLQELHSGSPKKSLSSPMSMQPDRNEAVSSNGIGRKSSLLRGLKHNRSSSGSISNSIAGFFSGKKDDKTHIRRVSDGSTSLMVTSPMISPPMRQFPAHNLSAEIEEEEDRLNALKDEVVGWEKKKRNLEEDVKGLSTEKNRLLAELKALQVKITAEGSKYDNLITEINALNLQKMKLKEESKHAALTRTMTNIEAGDNNLTPTNSAVYSGPLYKGSSDDIAMSMTEATTINEEAPDQHKSTRLMFWRRGRNDNSAVASNNSKSGSNLSLMTNSNSQTTRATPASTGKGKFTRSISTNILDSFIGDSHNNNHANGLVNSAPLFSTTIARRAESEGAAVPLIIRKCLTEVEKRGLDFEGIYRISGGNSSITVIEGTFANLNPKPDSKSLNKLNEVLGSGDINSVTSALKRYLRKLPDPIISYDLYDAFIDISKMEADRSVKIEHLKKQVVEKLPQANRETLSLLCRHLRLVDSMKGMNKMNFKNLSVVFAPTLARDEVGDREMSDMAYRNETTEILLSESDKIFS